MKLQNHLTLGLSLVLILMGLGTSCDISPEVEEKTRKSASSQGFVSPVYIRDNTSIKPLPAGVASRNIAYNYPISQNFGVFTFTTQKPDWSEMTPGEKRLLAGYIYQGGTEVVNMPVDFNISESTKYLHANGLVPASLSDLYPDLQDTQLKTDYENEPDQTILEEQGSLIDPIEGDWLKINPSTEEPGTLIIKEVTDQDLWDDVARAYALDPTDPNSPRPTQQDASLVWYQVLGQNSRVLAEKIHLYWPDSYLDTEWQSEGSTEAQESSSSQGAETNDNEEPKLLGPSSP